MKRKVIAMLTITTLAITSLVGCGGSKGSTSSTKTVYGQVTSINGNEITVTVLNKTDETETGNGEKPSFAEGEKPSRPEGETYAEGEMPTLPEGETYPEGEMASMPEGETFQKGERPTLPEGQTFSEEEMESIMASRGGKGMNKGIRGYETTDETLTVDVENATISKKSGDETNSAQASDISENSIVEITYTNDTASKVVIQQSMGGGMNRQDMKKNNSNSETESTAEASL